MRTKKIFISYRREDSSELALTLFQGLNDARGITKVFMDVDGIPPGKEFDDKIFKELSESDVCIVLIGKGWIGHSKDGSTARIYDDADYVRREVIQALDMAENEQIKVIPILVDGFEMSALDKLPEKLDRIRKINGVDLRTNSFKRDLKFVVDSIFSRREPTHIGLILRNYPILIYILKILGGAIVAAIGLWFIAQAHLYYRHESLDEALGPGMTILLIVSWVSLGALVPAWLAARR